MARIPVMGRGQQQTGLVQGGQLREVGVIDSGRGLSDLGGSVANIALDIKKQKDAATEAFKKANDARTLNNEVAGATKSLSLFTQELKSNPDNFDKWQTAHEEYTKTTLEDARKRLNPQVYGAFESDYKRLSTRSFIDTTSASRKVLVDKGRADLDSNLSVYNDLYATQSDPGDRKLTLGQAYLSISGAQNTGFINEQEAVAKREAFLRSVEETRLKNDILNDPELAKLRFDDDEYAIPEEQKPGFSKVIDSSVKAQKQDEENKANETKRLAKIVLQEAQIETGNEFIRKNLAGELTNKDVLNSNLNPTGENGKKSWLKAIEDRAEKVKKADGEWKTDQVVLADLQTRITLTPESVTDVEIMNAQGNGLSTSDAKAMSAYLAKKMGKDEDPQKTQEAKIANRILLDAKYANFYSSKDVENSELWGKDVALLKKWIETHPDDDPQDYVNQLLKPVKDGFLRRIFRDDFQTKEQRRLELQREAGIIPEQADQKNTSDIVTGEILGTVKTKEDYDALPSGTMFIEDGKKYRKP